MTIAPALANRVGAPLSLTAADDRELRADEREGATAQRERERLQRVDERVGRLEDSPSSPDEGTAP